MQTTLMQWRNLLAEIISAFWRTVWTLVYSIVRWVLRLKVSSATPSARGHRDCCDGINDTSTLTVRNAGVDFWPEAFLRGGEPLGRLACCWGDVSASTIGRENCCVAARREEPAQPYCRRNVGGSDYRTRRKRCGRRRQAGLWRLAS